MQIEFKKVLFYSLAVALPCLAQEAPMDAKEVTMSTPPGNYPRPDECERNEPTFRSCEPRVEEYDYDVYTMGGEERSEEPSESHCGSLNEKYRRKSHCDDDCKRKGAAKVAQE